jgi:hypothetical protein
MQRLFTMFPAGVAGVALLILRLCVAGSVSLSARFLMDLAPHPVGGIVAGALALALCVGAFTPVTCALILLAHVWALTRASNLAVDIVIHAGVTVSLLMLGPGAYSVDARLFGRRLIFPRDKSF